MDNKGDDIDSANSKALDTVTVLADPGPSKGSPTASVKPASETDPLLPKKAAEGKTASKKSQATTYAHYMFNWTGLGDLGTAGFALIWRSTECAGGGVNGYDMVLEMLHFFTIVVPLIGGMFASKKSALFGHNPVLSLARTHHRMIVKKQGLKGSLHKERKKMTSKHMKDPNQMMIVLIVGGLEAGLRASMSVLRLTAQPGAPIILSCVGALTNHARMSLMQIYHKYKSMKRGMGCLFLTKIILITLTASYFVPLIWIILLWRYKYEISHQMCPAYNGTFNDTAGNYTNDTIDFMDLFYSNITVDLEY